MYLAYPFDMINFTNLFYYSVYFLLLFMGPTALFSITHEFHYTISTNFYIYLQYFQQKVFSFRVYLGSAYFAKTENFLLKVL